MRPQRLLPWLSILALIAAPLIFASPAQAESGCHRTGGPTPPPPTANRNG